MWEMQKQPLYSFKIEEALQLEVYKKDAGLSILEGPGVPSFLY